MPNAQCLRNGVLGMWDWEKPVTEKRTYQDLAPILKCLAEGLGEQVYAD
jgi:hypothetical protein